MNVTHHAPSFTAPSSTRRGSSFRTSLGLTGLRLTGLGLTSAGAAILGLLVQGCGSGHPPPVLSGYSVGDTVAYPHGGYVPANPITGSANFVVDASSGGQASSVKLRAALWGRLVNVYDRTPIPNSNPIQYAYKLQNTDMVVGEDIRSDNLDFELDVNAITEETSVRILHPAGTSEYNAAFARLDQFLTPIVDKSLEPDELPPFTLVPRNSAIVLKFDDLIDVATITRENLRVVAGYPAVTPFDGRVIPDINHGDLYDSDGDGVLEFHTTRVILDTTVSSVEAATSGLPVNNIGLPGSVNNSQANIGVRIPTRVDPSVGQLGVLANLTGKAVSSSGNGSIDATVTTVDVVRGVRSGKIATADNPDPHNGFLVDEIPPRLVGVQAVNLTASSSDASLILAMDYSMDACASKPKVGDIIKQPGVTAQVTLAETGPIGGTVSNVYYRIVLVEPGSAPVLSSGPAQIFTVWDPVQNNFKEGCFVRYSSVAPGTTQPGTGVSSDGRVFLRFSEPMDPASVTAFDDFPLLRVNPDSSTPTARDFVVGAVVPSSDLKEYRFDPVINFKHTIGSSNDNYWVSLSSGTSGPLDLAGNPLANPLPTVKFSIDPADATENNASLVFRFGSLDELGNDTFSEWRGQFLTDVVNGLLKPRPVTRYSATCDRTIPVPGVMPTFTQGVQTPLSGLGSKMQTLWRYCDVGFALNDESNYNIDIEHLYWAPAGGNVVADTFDLFEMRLCHTSRLPDESVDPTSLLPIYPNSGLIDIFNNNQLDPTNDPLKVVHPRASGYVLDPGDRKQSSTLATTIMPYPLNWTIPVSDYVYYTWRDTALLAKGAVQDSPGAELRIVCSVVYGNTTASCVGCPYTNFGGTNPAPSIALPLLMEFRCFPDSGALGINALDINLALNSSAKPNFRAFSTGGTNSSGVQVQVNPDLNDIAVGGFNPSSTPPGLTTLRFDNTVYLGQMDLVLRLSRMHSIWIDTSINAPTYMTPVVEPRDVDQPLGTRIELAYRGAISVSPVTANILKDATFIDNYGNPTLCVVPPPPPPAAACGLAVCTTNGVVTFFQTNSTWRSSLSQINGAKFFQTRATFVSNTDTNLSPTLSALGFAFKQ